MSDKKKKPKYEEAHKTAVEMAKKGEFYRVELPGTPAHHDTIKYLKRKGWQLEEIGYDTNNSKNTRSKKFKATFTGVAVGARTGAASKAGKLLPTSAYCPITNQSSKHTSFNVDHRNGRIVMENNDYAAKAITKDNVESLFMRISTTANSMKREGCRRCALTGTKEPALINGQQIDQGDYDEQQQCNGCFWHSPVEFSAAYYRQ